MFLDQRAFLCLRNISTKTGYLFLDNDKETIMDKIQEIAEKVAGLAPGTCADTSGSEASEYSSWILKESQRYVNNF